MSKVIRAARSTLNRRPKSVATRMRHADTLANFALLVDIQTGRDMPTAQTGEYATAWNHAIAVLRQRLGLPEIP